MKRITIELTDAQWKKLQQLAEYRTREGRTMRPPQTYTAERCLVEFVNSCQPGGSGWKPPWQS